MAKANRQTRFHRLFSFRRCGATSARRPMIGQLESRTYLTTTFSGPTNFPGVSSPTAIAVGDFNNGTAGVAVEGYAPSASTTPVVGVYLQSSGAFGTPTLNPLSGAASGVAAGDFLNNGDQDIAALDSSTNTLNVFLGDGQGDFSPGAGASLGGTPGDTALATADFNGDGKVDIAAVDPNDDQVVTFISTSEGAFVAGATISVPSPIGVVAADSNGDNHPDLAILSSNGSVYIAINNGSGGFNAPVAYSLGAAGADPDSMVVANLVSGQAPDLAIVGSAANGAASAIVLLNNGDGTFGAATVAGSVPANPLSILAGNFTGSGHTDLAVLDAEGGLTVIPGNGDGTFGATQSIFTNQLKVGAAAVATDFNGDGLTDIAYLDSASGGFSELINTSNGHTITPTSPIVPALLSPVPATTFVAGQKIKPIQEIVKLTNTSNSTISGKVSVTLTLSPTAGGAAGAPVVASYSKSLVLKSGKNDTIHLQIKSIPAGLDGSYYVRAAIVDPSSDTNAVASATAIHVAPASIDLTGAFVSPPTSAAIGKDTVLTFSVTNLGTTAAVGPLTIDIDTSDAAHIDSSTATFDVVTIKKIDLKPGGDTKIHIKKAIAAGLPSPFYFVGVVDPNNVYHDVNLLNNVFATPAITLL
jgi:hypothetical protein